MSLEVVVLKDDRATARILPGFGFNCFSYEVESGGRARDLLWSHPDFASGNERASASGIPILFPFPGRIRGTRLHYEGRDYPLEVGDGAGNAIHGFVIDRPWRVLEVTPARAVGQFQASVDEAGLLRRWPADFRITVSYELRAGALVSDLRVDNPGEQPLPFGLGTHAYYRLPIAQHGVAEECIVTVPATQAWQLVELLPTGRIDDTGDLLNLAEGRRFGDCHLDNALTGLHCVDGKCVTSVHDPADASTLLQIFDETLPHCVVYTPPHREAICMEPYTCVPDAFRLEADGVKTGLRRLKPGHSYQTTIEIRLVTG